MTSDADDDDKNAKFETEQQNRRTEKGRRVVFYVFFFTLLADVRASAAEVLNHLTLWSWIVHTLYFGLHLPSSPFLVRLLHGPSFTGAHALFAMYCWTLYANPDMEFDLAPEGRPRWLVLARAFFLHFAPVMVHWVDVEQSRSSLKKAYADLADSRLFRFWVMVGGYFAMGLTWEQVNADAGEIYNVESMSQETYVNVSKALGVLGCVVPYFATVKPKLFG